MIRIILLEHADDSFPTNDVDPLPSCVKEDFIALSGGSKPSDFVAGFGVQDDHHRGLPGS
jgi:hypothetical protein